MIFKRFLILAVLLACMTAPVLAGEKYLYGSPALSAAISGTNQFSPGQDIQLPVVIQNTGLNELKIVQSTIVSRDDLPNTAKLVTVGLSSGAAPVTVKTDPQMIGDILGGASKPCTFHVTVARDAAAGTYDLPLRIEYRYLAEAEQYGTDMMRYFYETKQITLPMRITVTPDARVEVLNVTAEHLNVGTEGYLTLTLKNAGFENAQKAVAKIVRNGNSPVIPTDSSVFIGEFPSGSTRVCTYKVSVSSNAEEQVYPLNVYLEYQNSDGAMAQSEPVTVGIPIGGKIAFSIVSSSIDTYPGGKHVIEVRYQNVGAATAYKAQARLSAVDPFTSNDDTSYLGDLEPGGTATARFEVSVDAGATSKQYGMDSEIRYRDALDKSHISDTMKVQVNVVPRSGTMALLSSPIILSVIAAGCLGAGYYLVKYRRKKA
jgi:hypothetical protein